jgi:outer membrane lipoprotein
MYKHLAITLLAASVASCATVPKPLQGQFSPTTPRDAVSGADGQAVRWGGEIIKVEPKQDTTCFEILARELNANARPSSQDPSDGRFIACRSGFYDPEEFERGRDITVVGRVTGTEQGKVGQFDYTYPHVDADAIFLWPIRSLYARSPYYDPWMYGYGYGPGWGFGPYWGPYWGGPTVIIRDHPTQQPRPQPPVQPRQRQ